MNEIWKDIKGYEGWYQVSSQGRVRSLDRFINCTHNGKRKVSGRVLVGSNAGRGYVMVILTKNSKQTYKYVHRLVAEAFIPNPDNLPQVNHKDENKTNNCVDNLEWCDNLYNINYGTVRERITKKTSKQVQQFDENMLFVKQYPSQIEASRETGILQGAISQSISKGYKAGGFYWKLAS